MARSTPPRHCIGVDGSAPGTLCLRVFDAKGTITTETTFSVDVAHP